MKAVYIKDNHIQQGTPSTNIATIYKNMYTRDTIYNNEHHIQK